ncbi:hypothetical protein PIB30_024725 [Stylosanthes scabra]|uniref:Spermidine hydroxycinnamoyl transferase n=1 Tax=Stylosanthes scabra TaxID=79078 RepID=A0ABU6SA21_9FABA|nr:hypothetical protein [Stylosanthes scabra]
MVTIIESYVVTPKEETPKGDFFLSEIDQICRWSPTPSIYIYNNNSNLNVNELLQRMRDSLSEILVHYYPLCGRLNWIQGGRLKLDCNAKGAILLQAESTKSMAEYGDFSPNDDNIKELVPKVDYSQPIEELPLFLAQVTKFHGGNAIAIGIAISHPLSDGVSAFNFINSWAKLTRGDSLDPDELPFLDRTVFTTSRLPRSRRFDHQEFKPPPLILGRTDNIEERKKKTKFALLKLTAEQVQKLKQKANIDNSSESEEKPYSRFEAIGAYMWQCACKAHGLDKDQPTRARTVVDVRNKVNPPLSKNYFGNVLARTVTTTCYAGEITSKPLSYGAQKIREAVKMGSNEEYIRSQLEFVAQLETMDIIRTKYKEKEENRRADVPFYGNPNIMLNSWVSMPMYEVDFGLGKPDYFGPGAVYPLDFGIIAPSPHTDGSIDIFMNFQMADMQNFINIFWDNL